MKHGNWTVVIDDKKIGKKTGLEAGTFYEITDDSFWNDSKWSNIWAIQFTDDNQDNDQVEYRDTTPHSSYDANILGDFSQFITRWDSAHLVKLQKEWDEYIVDDGTTETKIQTIGSRPTTYSSI